VHRRQLQSRRQALRQRRASLSDLGPKRNATAEAAAFLYLAAKAGIDQKSSLTPN
jgi:hypothetical protein